MTTWAMLVCLRIVAAGLGANCNGDVKPLDGGESVDFNYDALVPDPTGGWYRKTGSAEVIRCKTAGCVTQLRGILANIKKTFDYAVPVIDMPRHNAWILFLPDIKTPDGGPPELYPIAPTERDFARLTVLAPLWDRSELR